MGATSRLLYSISRVAQHIISDNTITPVRWAFELNAPLHEEERAWIQVEDDPEPDEFRALQRDVRMVIASSLAGDHRVHYVAKRNARLARAYQDEQRPTWRKAWERRMLESAADTKSACFQWIRAHEMKQ